MPEHKVLVIDDEEVVRESVRIALRREGYELLFAEVTVQSRRDAP